MDSLRPFGGTISRLPAYVKLGRALLSDPRISRPRKVALGAAVGYAISPIDLVPGFIPIAGQLDDIAVVLIALRVALGGLPAGAAAQHLESAGLTTRTIDTDLATVALTSKWLAGKVGVAGLAAARVPVRALGWAGRQAAKLRR